MTVSCDNTGAVAAVNSGYSRSPQLMHLLRCLFYIRAHFQLEMRACHVPGTKNIVATVAAQQGIQDSLIRTMGRWESTAYLRYIRTPKEVLCGVAATLTGRMQGRNGCQDHSKGQD